MNERRLHQFFEVSVLLKGAQAVVECVSGVALAFASHDRITQVVGALTQHELSAHPHDRVAAYLLSSAQQLSAGTQRFYAFYLFSHGLVKIGLVAGLLRKKLWAYPASLVVLGLFIAYQLHRFSVTGGFGLIALTVFDLVVMALIWHEYRVVRRTWRAR